MTTVAQYTIEIGFDDSKAKAGVTNYRNQLASLGAASGGTASQLDFLRNSLGGVGAAANTSAANQNNLSTAIKNEGSAARAAAAANDALARSHKAVGAAAAAGAVSARSHQAGMAQLGQQLQDVSIQAQMGVEPLKILAMQGGQVATAMSLMGGAAGRVGTFLAGPFGVAIMIGVSVLGSLASSLFTNKQAMEQLRDTSDNLGAAQGALGKMFDFATGRITNNTQAIRDNVYWQMLQMQVAAKVARAEGAKFLKDSSLGETSKLGRAWEGAVDYALGGNAYDTDKKIKARDARGKNLALMGDGVAAGRMSLEAAGTAIQEARKKGILKNDKEEREALEYMSYRYEERTASQAATDIKSGLDGKMPSWMKKAPSGKAPKGKDTSSEMKKLAEFGESAAEKIKRINEAFDDQPKLVDRVNQSTRELDGIIKDLMEKKPKGFEQMIKDAEAAKKVVAEALLKPFNEMNEAFERQSKIQSLILAGRDDEAEALSRINQLIDKVGFATEDQRKRILANVEAERKVNEEIAKRNQIIGAYNDTIGDLRSNLEGLLSGQSSPKDFLKNFADSIRQLQGKLLTERVFGSMFRDLEEWVKKETGVKSAVDIFNEGAKSAGDAGNIMATALENAAARVDKTFAGGSTTSNYSIITKTIKSIGLGAGGAASVMSAKAANGGQSAKDILKLGYDPNAEIVVSGSIPKKADDKKPVTVEIAKPSLLDFVTKMQKGFGSALSKEFGDRWGPTGAKVGTVVGNVWGGIMGGSATAGKVGGVLGGLKGLTDGIKDIAGENSKLGATMGKIGKGLDKALGGAQTGTQVAQYGKMLWGKFSTTGSQLGGSIGALTGIPGGDIIGSIIGGTIGGLLKKTKKASQSFNFNENGSLVLGSLTGNSNKFKDAASGAGNEVISGLYAIAKQLGGNLSSVNMASIGIRDGKWRVDPDGSGDTKKKKGAIDFGKDGAEAAIDYVIRDALKKGVITGLSEFSTRIVKVGSDAMIDLAVRYETMVKDLEMMKDPLGAGLKSITKEIDDMVRAMKDAGATTADLAKVEEYRGLKLKAYFDDQISGLTEFRKALDGEGSGVTKYNQLLAKQAEYEAMKSDKAAGKTIDQSKFIEIGQELFGLSREVYGTATSEFQGIRGDLKNTTDGMIATAQSEYEKAMQAATAQTAQAATATANNTAISNEYLAQIAAAIQAGGLGIGTYTYGGGGGTTVNGTRLSENRLL